MVSMNETVSHHLQVLRRKAIPLIEFHGPLEMIAFSIGLKNCEFPEPGLYYIQVNFGGKLLGKRFLEVISHQDPER